MTQYVLISFKTCPWVQRAAIVLREKKIDFEFRHIEPDNRPDWFLKISPHKKVPILYIDERVALFESAAIVEYLDETIAPRLHPDDPEQRAINRAWNEFIPTLTGALYGPVTAETEADYDKAVEKIATVFGLLEGALEKQDSGPFFNGAKYSLVDAGFAPFLQRHLVIERVKPSGRIDRFPRLKAWADTLVARPSTHTFPPAEFEAIQRAQLKQRNSWISQFIED
jgi:glutathione S-transferase